MLFWLIGVYVSPHGIVETKVIPNLLILCLEYIFNPWQNLVMLVLSVVITNLNPYLMVYNYVLAAKYLAEWDHSLFHSVQVTILGYYYCIILLIIRLDVLSNSCYQWMLACNLWWHSTFRLVKRFFNNFASKKGFWQLWQCRLPFYWLLESFIIWVI